MLGNIKDVILGTIQVLEQVTDGDHQAEADLAASQGSMGRFLSSLIIEPQVFVSETLRREDITQDAISANIETFIMLYKRTFDMLLSVYGFDQQFALDILSSKTKYDHYLTSNESLDDLTVLDTENRWLDSLTTESNGTSSGETNGKILREVLLKSRITKNGKSVDIQIKILVAARVMYIPSSEFIDAVDTNGERNGFWSRLDDYKAGSISLFNFIFADDLIKEYSRKRISTPSELIRAIENRNVESVARAATKHAEGFVKYYQMLILSKVEKQKLERIVHGKLKQERYKNKVLNATYSMLASVIDTDYDFMEFYIHGINGRLELPFKAIKNSKGSSDNSDILKWLMQQRY